MNTAEKIIHILQNDSDFKREKPNSTYLELVELFPLRKIVSSRDYRAALMVLEKLMGIKDKGVQMYLDTLADLISHYEKKKFQLAKISGREMLAYLMELKGMTQMDVAKELGGQPNVSKILKGERELNLRQIKALAVKFEVDPSVFI